MTSYDLGTPVRFTHNLHRVKTWVHEKGGSVNEWKPRLCTPATGIVIGVRTLADGLSVYEHEAGNQFSPARHYRAYLVSYALRRSPVLVLPEHLTPTAAPEVVEPPQASPDDSLFGVYEELLTAALALRAQADRINETVVAANCTRWEQSAEVLHHLRLARTTAQVGEEALTKWIAAAWREVGLRDPQELDGVGVIDVRRGKERKAWDHEGLGPAVIDANLEKVAGEVPDPFTVARWVLEAAAPSYWRTGVLKGLGIDPDEWCEHKPGRVSVQITTHDHIGATA